MSNVERHHLPAASSHLPCARRRIAAGNHIFAVLALTIAAGGACAAPARQHEVAVLYSFTGGNDGGVPQAGLIADKAGNLYGTTTAGCVGYGAVYKLAADGTETVLHCFTSGADGALPYGSLIIDKAGNLYGTTFRGGAANRGTVFQITPGNKENVLYAFATGSDGDGPKAGLTEDRKGNLYGTTETGGTAGSGSIFKIAPNGTESLPHSFTGGSDGANPGAALLADKAGNLYGTTVLGGASGSGTVFKLAPDGTETVLYAFTGGNDGGDPYAPLIADSAGNLYGTAGAGANSYGVVFEVTPGGVETVLHTFAAGNDGADAVDGLIRDGAGNFYGTTVAGGSGNSGTVFKLTPTGNETVLYAFSGQGDGCQSVAALVKDAALAKTFLFGTTSFCGAHGNGTVFKLKK